MKNPTCRTSISFDFSGVRILGEKKQALEEQPAKAFVAHDYRLSVSWLYMEDQQSLLNKVLLETHFNQLIQRFDGAFLGSVVIAEDPSISPHDLTLDAPAKDMSLESLIVKIFDQTKQMIPNFADYDFEFTLTEGLRRKVRCRDGRHVLLTQSYKMNCLHQHMSPELSEKENESLFYSCANLHGHEYKLEVSLGKIIDREQNMVISAENFDAVIDAKIIKKYDNKYLNDFFGNSSGEIITQHLATQCRMAFPEIFHSICLQETNKNSFYSIPIP